MSADTLLVKGRAAAAQLMVDTCLITYVTGQDTDPLTGNVVEQRATRYAGPCRLQDARTTGQRVNAGELTDLLLRQYLQLPIEGTEDVAKGDRVTVTVSTHDAALVGRTWRIRDTHHKTHATARRLWIEEDS